MPSVQIKGFEADKLHARFGLCEKHVDVRLLRVKRDLQFLKEIDETVKSIGPYTCSFAGCGQIPSYVLSTMLHAAPVFEKVAP